MRKHLVWVLGLALAVSITAVATAENTQKLSVNFKPAKAPKTKSIGGVLHTITTAGTTTTGPGAIKPANKVQVFFDNDFTFNTKGIKSCDPAKIQGSTTAEAMAACGKSLVGKGKATVGIAGSPDPAAEVTGVISAFVGPPQGSKPTIVLHTRVESIGSTTVLTGVLSRVKGDLGNRLDVVVPPLAGGSALKVFDVTVTKKTGTNNFVSARCADKNKTWNFKGIFNYSGGEPTKTVTATQKCTVRS